MRKYLLLFFFLCISVCSIGQKKCPTYGSATASRERKLNIYKNESVKIDPSVTLEDLPLNKLITSKKKGDSKNWKEGALVVTEGFLVSFEEEGAESCNC